jgi:hypothetical protein
MRPTFLSSMYPEERESQGEVENGKRPITGDSCGNAVRREALSHRGENNVIDRTTKEQPRQEESEL